METAGDMTVLGAIDGQIEGLRARGGAESTIELYGASRKAIEREGLGDRIVAYVTVRDVERYLSWRRTHVWRTKGRPGKRKAKAFLVQGGKASASTVAWILGVFRPREDGLVAESSPQATRATRNTAMAAGAVKPNLNLMSSYSGRHFFNSPLSRPTTRIRSHPGTRQIQGGQPRL